MAFFEDESEKPTFDRERFREAILYVCSLVENPRDISETKLHKILFYADRKAYLELGDAITGASYIRHQFGPYSERLEGTLELLEEEGSIALKEFHNRSVDMESRTQTCPQVTRGPNTDLFSEEELKILTGVARSIFPLDSEDVSEKSHDVVWRSTEEFEEIPYETAYLDATEPDERDEVQEWARQRAQEIDV